MSVDLFLNNINITYNLDLHESVDKLDQPRSSSPQGIRLIPTPPVVIKTDTSTSLNITGENYTISYKRSKQTKYNRRSISDVDISSNTYT